MSPPACHLRPLQPAFIGVIGRNRHYRELEARSNRLAHLFATAPQALDHYSIFMENNIRIWNLRRRERSALYTCVNSYLTASELAYILTNAVAHPHHLEGKTRCRRER